MRQRIERLGDAGELIARDLRLAPQRDVARMPDACGVDIKIPRLRVLQKGWGDPGGERIGIDDDRLGVIGNDDGKGAAEKLPGASQASIARAVVSSNVG